MKKEYDFSKGKRGAVVSHKGKTRITIYLDDEVLDRFRLTAERSGKGYQTLINDALLEHVHRRSTLDAVRQALREELAPYGIARRATSSRQPRRSTRP